MKIPAELSSAIEQHLARYEPRALARAAAEISERYRGNSSGCNTALTSPLERAAYLATRLPATFAAAYAALQHLKLRMPSFAPNSLLDPGAGPGTASWAALQAFPALKGITLIERDAPALQLGRELSAESSSVALQKAIWIQADLLAANFSSGADREYDLVVLSYALGELPQRSRSALLQRIWKACAHAVLIVEPGTPGGYQNIIAARAELVRGGAHIAAPCPHERECPLQKISGEWCHFAQRLERTSLHRRLKQGEHGYEDEKFSYIAVSRNATAAAPARIIRHPQRSKGRIQLQLCAGPGLQSLNLTKSEKESFRAARRSKWGDEWMPLIEEK